VSILKHDKIYSWKQIDTEHFRIHFLDKAFNNFSKDSFCLEIENILSKWLVLEKIDVYHQKYDIFLMDNREQLIPYSFPWIGNVKLIPNNGIIYVSDFAKGKYLETHMYPTFRMLLTTIFYF